MLDRLIKYFPSSHKINTPEQYRLWSILVLVMIIAAVIQIFFIGLVTYQEKMLVGYIAYFSIPCLLVSLSAFYFYYKNNYKFSTLAVLIPGTLNAIFLIYYVGGINAPGPFWLAILPVFYGTFFNVRGAHYGVAVSLLSYIGLVVADSYGIVTAPPYSKEDLYKERVINLISFTIGLAMFYSAYTSAYLESNQKLESQRERIDNLFRVVLHDITNPLSAATLRMSLMKKSNNYSDSYKVENSLSKIADIIKSLRDFKSIEDGSVVIKMKAESIGNIVDKFKRESKDLFDEKALNFVVQSDVADKIQINCHKESLINQIFFNLLTNAIKFSPENSNIYFKAFKVEDEVCFELRDEGIGIPDSILKNLFKFDKPTSRSGTNGEEGTGYGMPIAKYFIKAMGGKIEVESTEKSSDSTIDHGTIFKIYIPVSTTG